MLGIVRTRVPAVATGATCPAPMDVPSRVSHVIARFAVPQWMLDPGVSDRESACQVATSFGCAYPGGCATSNWAVGQTEGGLGIMLPCRPSPPLIRLGLPTRVVSVRAAGCGIRLPQTWRFRQWFAASPWLQWKLRQTPSDFCDAVWLMARWLFEHTRFYLLKLERQRVVDRRPSKN